MYGPEFGNVIISLIKGWFSEELARRLTPTSLPCTAPCDNTYVFGPDGYVYHCWHEVGHPKKAIDHIIDGTGNPERTLFWLNYDPLLFLECVDCKVLPLCLGVCP